MISGSVTPCSCARSRACGWRAIEGGIQSSHIHLERRDEGLLRNIDLAELAHALFAFLLLLEQLALARGIAPVAFGGHVLAERAHGLARDDAAADRRLDWNLEHGRRDQLFELLD